MVDLLALSIQQPWADLILAGHKDLENRTWGTGHRGPLAIHASRSRATLEALDDEFYEEIGLPEWRRRSYEFGAVLGVVDLVDCAPLRRLPKSRRSRWGEDDPEIQCWALANPRRFALPLRQRGFAALFHVQVPQAALDSAAPPG